MQSIVQCAVLALLIAVTGCAHVQGSNFAKFHEAVAEVQKSVDSVSEDNLEANKEFFIESVVKQEVSLPQLGLSFLDADGEDPYFWKPRSTILYLELKRAHFGLLKLNAALLKYAAVLETLATTDFLSHAEMQQMARDINTNSLQAMAALEIDLGDDFDGALLGTAAAALMERYVLTRQKALLYELIEANQGAVRQVCDHVIDYIRVGLLPDVTAGYQDRLESALGDSSGLLTRREQVEAVLKVNEDTVELLELLKSIELVYAALPAAHRDLQKTDGDSVLAGINSLFDYAIRLQGVYDSMQKKGAES